jgi:hypothetical protein
MAATVDNAVADLHRANAELQRPNWPAGTANTAIGSNSNPPYDVVTKQHRGAISVDSEVGVFTEFTIRLPCGPATRPWRAAGDP